MLTKNGEWPWVSFPLYLRDELGLSFEARCLYLAIAERRWHSRHSARWGKTDVLLAATEVLLNVSALAKELGFHKKTAQRRLAELIRAGVFEQLQSHRRRGVILRFKCESEIPKLIVARALHERQSRSDLSIQNKTENWRTKTAMSANVSQSERQSIDESSHWFKEVKRMSEQTKSANQSATMPRDIYPKESAALDAPFPRMPHLSYRSGNLALDLSPYSEVLRGAQVNIESLEGILGHITSRLHNIHYFQSGIQTERKAGTRCVYEPTQIQENLTSVLSPGFRKTTCITLQEPTTDEIRREAGLFILDDFEKTRDFIQAKYQAMREERRYFIAMAVPLKSRAQVINEQRVMNLFSKEHHDCFTVCAVARDLFRNGELGSTIRRWPSEGPYRYLSVYMRAILARALSHARQRLIRRKAALEGRDRHNGLRFNPFVRQFGRALPCPVLRRRAMDRLRDHFPQYFEKIHRGHRDELLIAAHCYALAHELDRAGWPARGALIIPFPRGRAS